MRFTKCLWQNELIYFQHHFDSLRFYDIFVQENANNEFTRRMLILADSYSMEMLKMVAKGVLVDQVFCLNKTLSFYQMTIFR